MRTDLRTLLLSLLLVAVVSCAPKAGAEGESSCGEAGQGCSAASPCCSALACGQGICIDGTAVCGGESAACSAHRHCCPGRTCSADGICCNRSGERCDEARGCCEGLACAAGRCRTLVTCREIEEPCGGGEGTCCGSAVCLDSRCCREDGARYERNPSLECCSGVGGNGTCGRGPSCSNLCSAPGEGACVDGASFKLCGQHDADPCLEWSGAMSCPSGGSCTGGTCTTLACQSTIGGECKNGRACCAGMHCCQGDCPMGFPDGYCCLAVGERVISPSQCCTGYASGGFCAAVSACRGALQSCSDAERCCSGMACTSGYCCKNAGQTFTGSSLECCSRSATGAVCN